MASATKQALLAALSAAQGECISGQQLAQALRERGVECEYADPRYVVLMPSPRVLRQSLPACKRPCTPSAMRPLLPMSPYD